MKIKNIINPIENKDFRFNRKSFINIALIIIVIFSLAINLDNKIVKKEDLKEYKALASKIESLNKEHSKYYEENNDEISKYLDLKVKYEEVCASFDEYKAEHPKNLAQEVNEAKEEVNKLYAQAIVLENKVKEAEKTKLESQVAASSNNSSSNSYSGSSSNNYKNSSSNKHIGKKVYVSNGNSYYHAIHNCKYLEGAPTSLVTLTSGMRKYECNCWTNPIVYKPSSSSSGSSSGGGSVSGKTVYIASGNSYYHKSPSCKFLNGASARAVDLNNVGGKHACNCIKY